MARHNTDKDTREIFIKEDEQLQLVDRSLEQEIKEEQEVECLDQTFPSDTARREHYLKLLAEKLKDPEFRKTHGFPKAEDEDILRLSDPPYYTACPNPFLGDFVEHYGRPYSPDEEYHREPFAVDVSEGKTDQLYKAHGYHTKVPHLAIVPTILHYTEPGDIVLDGFAGSGMTGVAAQWCGTAPKEYRQKLEGEWKKERHQAPKWGPRKAILGDLGPAATFIAANYNIPFDVEEFAQAAQRILDEVEDELGWMYATRHTDGSVGRINYTVWSEVYSCPECAGEVVFYEDGFDKKTKRVRKTFSCPNCKVKLNKRSLDRRFNTEFDPPLGKTVKVPERKPVLIEYTVGKNKFEKVPDSGDLEILERVTRMELPKDLPTDRMMHSESPDEPWGDEWRAGVASFAHVHHLFLPRPAQTMALLWMKAKQIPEHRTRRFTTFFLEQAIWGLTVMARYAPTHYSQVNRYMNGRIRILSQHAECSPWYILSGKLDRLKKAFSTMPSQPEGAVIFTGDCATILLENDSVDYVFTDPPFGDNFAYSELNFILESWHKVYTEQEGEAIVSEHQGKGIHEYQTLMHGCFSEYSRVLKPGRWMTMVFSNSSNGIWHAIQEALGTAGFVIADVRTLDKKQGTFNQVHGVSVDQDLIISAYLPSEELNKRFALTKASPESVWGFIDEHLLRVPVFLGHGDEVETIVERSARRLFDRMTAFHVQRQVAVPLDSAEFLKGLEQRYPERDGMYFLPGQVPEYDRKRATAEKLRQLELFVSDEASAIQWVRQTLGHKPQSFQDLQPKFMKELQAWAKHEETVELQEILNQNFVLYEGKGPVPSQIHSYLSTQYRNLRGLKKDDPQLIRMAKGRWYVPDPNKAGDLEKLRARALLKEFEEYKASKKKLKQFRTEAVRAGFKDAYDRDDYETIVSVAERLPESVIQEDDKLLMYYDVALMRRR